MTFLRYLHRLELDMVRDIALQCSGQWGRGKACWGARGWGVGSVRVGQGGQFNPHGSQEHGCNHSKGQRTYEPKLERAGA